jgi:hypothetical protein
MSALPKRPWPYLAALLLIVLVALVAWMFTALDSEELQKAAAARKDSSQAQASNSAGVASERPLLVAPEIREAAAPLNADSSDSQGDLRTLESLLTIYRRIYPGNPVGENADITEALLGKNEKGLVAIPPDHPAIREGKIVDRWGTPYWFHPISGNVMEIRSAGPDKELFTGDDIVQQ